MNLFFGKISKKIDPQQIEEGYYISPKGSSWFGDLEIGDYVYLIGGDKIQLWKAREWGIRNERESLIFDVLNDNLGITVSQLIVLKFFQITKELAVLTSRSARNKAFFKLALNREVNLEQISSRAFYKDQNLLRKIRIIEPHDVEADSEDIQLFYDGDKLQLADNDFIEDAIKEAFVDNRNKIGGGAPKKDNVLRFFANALDKLPATITYNEIGFRSFYDAFFCEYKESEEFENKPKEDLAILNNSNESKTMNQPLNQILYGPPGTGKTYATKELAVKIANPEFKAATTLNEAEQRLEISKEYKRLFDAGQIVFTTFHQSMSYEDFVEGIKPVLDSEGTDDATDEKEGLKYEIQDGILKSISNLATGVDKPVQTDPSWPI